MKYKAIHKSIQSPIHFQPIWYVHIAFRGFNGGIMSVFLWCQMSVFCDDKWDWKYLFIFMYVGWVDSVVVTCLAAFDKPKLFLSPPSFPHSSLTHSLAQTFQEQNRSCIWEVQVYTTNFGLIVISTDWEIVFNIQRKNILIKMISPEFFSMILIFPERGCREVWSIFLHYLVFGRMKFYLLLREGVKKMVKIRTIS